MMDLIMKWICLNILDVWNPVLFDVHTIGVVTSIKESNISRMQQMDQDILIFLCTLDLLLLGSFCWHLKTFIYNVKVLRIE